MSYDNQGGWEMVQFLEERQQQEEADMMRVIQVDDHIITAMGKPPRVRRERDASHLAQRALNPVLKGDI